MSRERERQGKNLLREPPVTVAGEPYLHYEKVKTCSPGTGLTTSWRLRTPEKVRDRTLQKLDMHQQQEIERKKFPTERIPQVQNTCHSGTAAKNAREVTAGND